MRANNNLFQPAVNPAEAIIKKVFYNGLVDYMIGDGNFNYTRESLPQELRQGIAHLISVILENSRNCHGIRLPRIDMVISAEDCPEKYRQLFVVLMRLKNQPNTRQQLEDIARQIMALPSFNELNPTQNLLEMAGLASPVLPAAAAPHYNTGAVTADDIRETFYNLMFAQTEDAVNNGWLPLRKIQGQSDIIYTALPGLTVLAALELSRQDNGILLLCRKLVTAESCPKEENFPEFVASIMSIKNRYNTLTEQQLHVIKHKLCCKKDVPEHLKEWDNAELMEFLVVIRRMASAISQSKVFLKMTPTVFELCCEELARQSQSPPSPGRKPN